MFQLITLFSVVAITFTAWPWSFISAQTSTSQQYEQVSGIPDSGIAPLDQVAPLIDVPVLVADVNFSDVTVLSENAGWRIQFGIGSSFGSQDAVSVGVIVRETTGEILDHRPIVEDLFLPEGETKVQSIVYTPPVYVRTDAKVYLAAYSARGLMLAIREVGDVKQSGKAILFCESSVSAWVCQSEADHRTIVQIRERGPFGRVVKETDFSLEAGSPQTIDFSTISDSLPAGAYVISLLSQVDSKPVIAVAEYRKAGDIAKIVNVAPKVIETDQVKRLQVRVYAEALSLQGAVHALSVETGRCDTQTKLLDSPVVDFVFDIDCIGNDLRVSLLVDDTIADSLTVPFSVPGQESNRPSSEMLKWRDRLLYGVFALFVISLVFILGKRSLSRRKVIVGSLFILTYFGFSTPSVDAATYVIGGTAGYVGCITGGWPGCAEPDAVTGYRTTGTVTVPNSVDPGQTYSISVAHSLPGTDMTECADAVGGPYVACTSSHVRTIAYANLPAPGNSIVYGQFAGGYNTLPGGWAGSLSGYISTHPLVFEVGFLGNNTASGVFSRTAPLSGTDDTIAFVQNVSADWSVRCTNRCITYPYLYRSISVPMVTTTCDRGCGGSVQWRANSTNAVDDFTCPSGSKLMTNRGSWTGPMACQGTFTLDPFGGTMSCVADAACSAPPADYCHYMRSTSADCSTYDIVQEDDLLIGQSSPSLLTGGCATKSIATCADYGAAVCNGTMIDATHVRYTCNLPAPSCNWAPSGYIDGRQPPGANALHNSGRCTTPNPSDGTPLNSACNAGYNGGLTVCCDTGADCFRYTCSCAPPAGVPCWQLSSTRTVSAASCTQPMSPPLGPAFPACTAVNQGSLERRCDDDQPMLDLESTYMCGMCTGSAPTLVMTGVRQFGYTNHQSLWSRIVAFLRQRLASPVSASGPAVSISSGESVVLNWTTTGATSCTLTIPGQLPQAITPAQIATGTTVVSGLLAGSHTIRMTCADATGTQMVMDTVVVNVTPNELQICPPAITMTMGSVYQMRAFYLIGGVDCASLGPAIDVSNLVTWTSASPTIAAVGNNPTGGRINAGFTPGTANISISSYAGRTAPISRVTIVGGYVICPATPSMYVGDTVQLRAYFSALSPIDCSNLTGATEVTGSVTWSSSDTGVATVAAGIVTGATSGSTTISTGPYNGATAVPVTVTVSGGYAICPASAIVGSTGFSFHAYYNASGAVNCGNLAGTTDVTGSVTWTSSNPGVATVGNGGTAGVTTPVSIGSSNISTTPYLGIPSGNAVANVICIPTVNCASAGPAATAGNMCPGETFTIGDGCSGVITCPGTRICDFNWKEVGQ